MREFDEQELVRMEQEARVAEGQIEGEILEAMADATEVQSVLRELQLRLQEEQIRGAAGLDVLIASIQQVPAPSVPLEMHRARVFEVRADALRARLWAASAMSDDLKRFTFELGESIKVADLAKETLARLAEQPRINPRPRLERIRAVTADLAAKGMRLEHSAPHPRRKDPRIRLETSIDLHSRSNFYTGFAENISDGGLFVATDERLEIDTEIDLAFQLPGGHEVRARGVVQWHREESADVAGGIGIAFLQLSPTSRDAIEAFLETREPIYRVTH